jgi:hypothetical protein
MLRTRHCPLIAEVPDEEVIRLIKAIPEHLADLVVQVTSGEFALAATAKTVFTVSAPANQRLKVKGLEVFGKGTSSTDTPAKVELITYASISGGTAGSVTTSKVDGDMGETIQATIAGNYSAEPTYTTGVTVRTWEVHPQTGLVVYFPMHDEIKIKGGAGFAIRATQAQADTFSFNLIYEE